MQHKVVSLCLNYIACGLVSDVEHSLRRRSSDKHLSGRKALRCVSLLDLLHALLLYTPSEGVPGVESRRSLVMDSACSTDMPHVQNRR